MNRLDEVTQDGSGGTTEQLLTCYVRSTQLLLSIYCSDASLQDQLVTTDPTTDIYFPGGRLEPAHNCAGWWRLKGNSGSAAQLARGLHRGRWLDGPVLPYLAGQLGHLGGQSDVWAVGQRTSAAGLLAGLVTVADLTEQEQREQTHKRASSLFNLG